MMQPKLILVEFRSTRTVHAVYAAGNCADGSLHGFDTICGRPLNYIEGQENYYEPPATVPAVLTCQKCRCIAKED